MASSSRNEVSAMVTARWVGGTDLDRKDPEYLSNAGNGSMVDAGRFVLVPAGDELQSS
jgi:hypothetical protein